MILTSLMGAIWSITMCSMTILKVALFGEGDDLSVFLICGIYINPLNNDKW